MQSDQDVVPNIKRQRANCANALVTKKEWQLRCMGAGSTVLMSQLNILRLRCPISAAVR